MTPTNSRREVQLLSSVSAMKNAFREAQGAVFCLLCLFALNSAARAATNPPEAVTNETVANETVANETTVNEIAMTLEKPEKPAVVLALENAVEGLEMPSETDAPFKVVFFEMPAESAITPAQIAKLAGAPEDAEVETHELAEFFDAAATEEEWMNDEEKATAKRFASLLETLKAQLKDIQVVVWGDAEKQVAIIGKCAGGAAGVTTLVVET